MAEDILGISGQMDISDIQASLDKLCNDLNRVGVDTDALSQKMTKALNEVAKSDEDLSTKTSIAMQVLKTAMDEATQGIQIVPEMIDNANKHVETIEGTIGRLNEQLSKTDKSSEAFNSITKQIDIQKQSLELAKGDVKDLVESYDNVRSSISQVNGAYQALGAFSVASSTANAVQSATNISVGATATTAATATAAEAAAHISNAEAATQNAEAENQNVEATRQLTDALQQYISVASGRAEIERMQSENTKELKADIKLYEQAISDIQQKLGATDYAKNIEEATKKIEIQKAKIESYKEAISNLSSDDNQSGQGANYYNHLIQVAQENIDSLQSKINAMSNEQQRLNADLREYTTLLEAANQIQGGKTIVQPDSSSSTVSINVEDTSLSELNSKLEESKQRLQELEAETDKFSGKPLGDKQKADLENLQSEIEKTKNEISAIQEAIREKNEETFIGRLRNDISDIGQKLSDFGQSIKDKITQPIDDLKSKISNSSIGQRFGAEFEQAKIGLNDFKDGIINVLTANGKFQGEIGKVGEAFKALGIPVTGSLTAIKSVTKALWGMCATPIGAVIAAVAISFKALHTWLTKSAEGQKVLTKLSAYFGSLMSSITDIVVIFGKYLYHAFADNNAPMNSFAKSFIKTFKTAVNAAISLISGLGTTLKGIFTLDWDTFTDGLSKTWNGLKKAGTAAIEAVGTSIKGTVGALKTVYNMFTDDKLGKELGSAFNGIFTKASSAAKLAEQEQDANIQLGKEKEKQAKLDIQIAANREKIYTLTGKAKDAMIEETKALMKQKYDGQIKAQQQLYEIQKKRNQMHTASLSNIKKERDLHIGILNTQAQQMASTRMLTRMQEANRRSMEDAEKQKNKKAQTDTKKEQNHGNAVSSAEDKLANVIYGNAYDRVKAEKELEDAVTDAKIKAMEEGEEKVIAQRKRELEKEIQQIEEKKNALIKAERDRQKAEFEAQQAVIKAKGGKIEQWDDKKYLDNEPIEKITKQYDIIEQETVKNYDKEIYATQLQSMRDYLKKYGSFEQQKQAITEEYEEKIRKAQTKGEKLQLQQEQKKALANANFENMSMGIDWKGLLSGVGNMSKEMLKPMFDKLEAYTHNTDEFNQSGVDNQQKVVNLMQEIRNYLGTDQNATWEELANAISNFNGSVVEYNSAVDAEKEAISKLSTAKQDLKDGKITEDVFKKIQKDADDASQAVVDAKTKMNTFGVVLNSTTESVKNYTSGLTAALNNLGTWKNVSGFDAIKSSVGNIDSLKGTLEDSTSKMDEGITKELSKDITKGIDKSLGAIGNGIKDVMGSALGQLIGGIAQIPQMILQLASAIKDFVTGILNSVTELLQFEWLSDLVNSILDAVGNLIDAIFDLPENLFKAIESIVVKGVGGLLNSVVGRIGNVLSFGALSSAGPAAWFENSNAKEVQDAINNLTKSNESLQKSIDRLKDTMKDSYGKESTNAYKEAVRQQELYNANTLQKAIEQAGYHGSHNSWGYYWNGFSKQQNEFIRQNVKSDFNGDIWSLSPEEMKKLLSYQDLIDTIKYTGKSYYGESVLEKLEEYADLAGKINELSDEWRESITQISFDSMKDNFISNLMDMEKSAEDFADDFAEMMQKALLSYSMEDLINGDLKELYKEWADLMDAKNGTFDEKDVEKFQEEYQKIVDEGLKRRDEWAKVTGYTGSGSNSEQTATGKGIEAITEDQASSLIGIGYAMQIALEQGNEVRKGISLDVSFLRSYSETIGNNISEMRDIQYQGLEQLQAINKNTAPIILIREDIASMYKLMKDRY